MTQLTPIRYINGLVIIYLAAGEMGKSGYQALLSSQKSCIEFN